MKNSASPRIASWTRDSTHAVTRTCTRLPPTFGSGLPPRNSTSLILPTLMPLTLTGAPSCRLPM